MKLLYLALGFVLPGTLMAGVILEDKVFTGSLDTCTPVPSRQVAECYRIFLVITTQSDWTTVQMVGGGHTIQAVYTITEGENAPHLECWYDTHLNLMGVAKKGYDDTLVRIEITSIVCVTGDLTFEIKKGDIQYTTVEVYNYNTEPDLIKTFTALEVAGDPENTVEFSVAGNQVIQGGPLPFLESSTPKLVWAFYYPWYYKGQWSSEVLQDTPLFPHNSSDPDIIELHIKQALSAGIDGFIVSWWGENDYTDDNLGIILDVADEYDFKVSIIFESLGDDKPRSEEELTRMLSSFLRKYQHDDRFYTIEGNPVIFVWAAESHPPSVWQTIITTVKHKGYTGMYIAETGNPEYLPVFDGLHRYGTVGINDLPGLYQRLSTVCRTYGYLSDKKECIWAATISPGYDDRNIPGRQGLYQPRKEGEYYTETFEAALASSPDWLLITSFNEWWEHTHIEPSVNYGFSYLEMTAHFSFIFKGPTQKPKLLTAQELFDDGVNLFNLNSFEKAQSAFESALGIYDAIGYTEKSFKIQQYIEKCKEIGKPEQEPQEPEQETDKEAGISVFLVLMGFLIIHKKILQEKK